MKEWTAAFQEMRHRRPKKDCLPSVYLLPSLCAAKFAPEHRAYFSKIELHPGCTFTRPS